jgi:hypothetical protein
MTRNSVRRLPIFAALAVVLAMATNNAFAQSDGKDDQDKNFDVHSTVGDMHVGSDATPRELGLPVYPGARPRKHDDDRSNANLSLFTSAFGWKLVVANYDSDDDPAKIIAFYREKLKKYGKVLECRTSKHPNVSSHADYDSSQSDLSKSKELTCDADNEGPGTELKVGTEDNQHAVAVEPAENGHGATFALVYIRSRGKQGDI